MAGRYIGNFYSDLTDTQYFVTLFDADFAGTQSVFRIVDMEITYDADVQERFAPILAAKISLKIRINDAGTEALVQDMIVAEEGRFTITVSDGVFTPTLLLHFYMLIDLVSIEDAPHDDGVGYVFEMQGTDGIGRLKSIDYNNAGTAYSGAETFTEHIFNCINKLPAITALYTTGYILKVACNWRENSRTVDLNENPLDISRIDHKAFFQIDKDGNYIYKSCYDVLKMIAQAWGARILFSEYGYWFQQYNKMLDADDLYVYAYDKTQAMTVLTAQDITIDHAQGSPTITDVIKLAGGRFGFFPPLAYISLDYNHNADQNLLAGAVWPGSGTVTVTGLDDNSTTSRLRYTSRLDYTISGSPTPSLFPLYAVFEIRMRVDTLYWARTISWSGGSPVYGTPQWSATPGWFFAVLIPDSDEAGIIYPEILTEALTASGDLTFTVLLSGVYDTTGTTIGGDVGTLTWTFSANYLELLFNGSIAEQTTIRRFRNNNDTANQSAKIEMSTIIGDGPTLSAPGHIEVLSDLSAWLLSSQWRVGASGSFFDFNQLLINEIIRGQLTPVRRQYGAFLNVNEIFHAHKVMQREGDYYIFQTGSFRFGADEFSGEWWQLGTSLTLPTTGWTPADVVNTSSGGGSVATGGGSGSTGGTGGGSGGTGGGSSIVTKYFTEQFTGADFSANAFTVTENGGILPMDAAQILVFYNGVLTNEWSHTGSVITMSFQVYFSDIIVVHFFINV